MISYKGYKIKKCMPSGGKAGKGYNVTSTIQIFKEGESIIEKHIRYKNREHGAISGAVQKAKKWIDGVVEEELEESTKAI